MNKLPKGPYTYVPGNRHTFPCVRFPLPEGLTREREIVINEPAGATAEQMAALAQFIAKAPEVMQQLIDVLKEHRQGAGYRPGTGARTEAAIAAGEDLL